MTDINFRAQTFDEKQKTGVLAVEILIIFNIRSVKKFVLLYFIGFFEITRDRTMMF